MNTAIINDINYCKLTSPIQFAVNTNIATGPTPLSATQRYFRYVVITAVKDESSAANTGAVKLGASATASKQPITLNQGDSYVIQAPVGSKYDFRDFYFTVANDGDGLVVIGS